MPKACFCGPLVMHVACAFNILHDIRFLSVKRASAKTFLCLKTVWGLCGWSEEGLGQNATYVATFDPQRYDFSSKSNS